MDVDWALSHQLVSDGQGVRCAISVNTGAKATSDSNANGDNNDTSEIDAYQLLTGNQGGALCAFGVPSASLFPVSYQHNHSVTAMVLLPQLNLFATGCKDAKIRLFDVATKDCIATLEGHEKPVTSLAVLTARGHDGEKGTCFLLSGSWDGTAKVWDVARRAMIATLPDHENSVCVTGISNADDEANNTNNTIKIATGSAGIAQGNQISGHTVRIWTVQVKTGKVERLHAVANDHDGPIRDICQVNNTLLATSSNDGTIRLRSTETGESVSTLVFLQQQQQHPPMLLSVVSLDGGQTIAAGAEDGNVVLWQLQNEGEPQVLLHPGCVWQVHALPNDDLATCCDDGNLRIFTRASDRMAPISEQQAFSKAVQEAHAKKSTGPTPEEIAKLTLWEHSVNQPGTSEGQVQVFNKGGTAIAAQWSAVSRTWVEVGQVTGSSDGGMIDGESFDHVLPIEVDQTGGGVAKLKIGYNNGENPFMAAQRFIDKYMLPQHHLNDIANYIEQRVGSQTPTLGSEGAGASSVPVATTGLPMVTYHHLPMKSYKVFELPSKTATTTLGKMRGKIEESGKLSEDQKADLASMTDTLGATSRYHASSISSSELSLLSSMLDSFAPADVFPVLDLARLTVPHPDASAAKNERYWTHILQQAQTLYKSYDSLEGPAAVAVPMLTLRLFVNAFKGGRGSLAAAETHIEGMLDCANTFLASGNKNIRLSVATLIYNISFYLYSSKSTRIDIAAQVVTLVDKILESRTYETEGTIRCLVALGTTILAIPDVKDVAKTLFVVSKVEMAASPHGDLAKTVAKEVYQVLQ